MAALTIALQMSALQLETRPGPMIEFACLSPCKALGRVAAFAVGLLAIDPQTSSFGKKGLVNILMAGAALVWGALKEVCTPSGLSRVASFARLLSMRPIQWHPRAGMLVGIEGVRLEGLHLVALRAATGEGPGRKLPVMRILMAGRALVLATAGMARGEVLQLRGMAFRASDFGVWVLQPETSQRVLLRAQFPLWIGEGEARG